jgi:DNA-binding GntR family transcriptional regulator
VNVSMPSEAVIPTLDGPVLVALAKLAGPVTGRRVHQLAGVGSEAGVRNVLTRLVHQGIVHASPAGSAVLYSVNREHIAWRAVQALAGLRGELFSRLRNALSDWDLRPRTAALFGSVARGDGDADSDIDLLLIRQRRTAADNEAWQGQVSRLREDVMAWTGNTCQVYDIGSDDLERHIAVHDPLVAAWRADAITVYGTELRGVLRDLGHRVIV